MRIYFHLSFSFSLGEYLWNISEAHSEFCGDLCKVNEMEHKYMNNYEKIGDTVIIALPEEVDDYNAGIMVADTEDTFMDTRVKYVIFDFTHTYMMDSSGIGLITRRFRNVYDRGGKAFVLNVSDRMDRLLSMSGIYRIATKTDSVEAAYKSVHENV